MRPFVFIVAAALGCAPAAPAVVPPLPPRAIAPPEPREVDVVRAQVEALSAQLAASHAVLAKETWAGLLDGGTPGTSASPATREALTLIRRAQTLEVLDARRLKLLRLHVLGALLSRALADEDASCTHLSTSTTFTVEGKDVRLRDLHRTLANEASALKRKRVWLAAMQAMGPLDAALAHRDAVARQVIAGLEVPSMLEFEAEARELDLEALTSAAERLLQDTDDVWRRDVGALATLNVQLPFESVTRADMPRVLRPPAAVEAALPANGLVARALSPLTSLHLQPVGLTLDTTDSPKKLPAPVAVAVATGDVRLSLRPAPGLAALTAALDEVGGATAQAGATGPFEQALLGDPARPLVTGALFAASPCALEGLPPAVGHHARALRLFQLRRAAGVVLTKVATVDLPAEEAPARAVAIMSRALAVRPSPEDGARWRLDVDDFPRAASLLRAHLAASAWEAAAGDWCQNPDAGTALTAIWARGGAAPIDELFGPLAAGVAPLVARLRDDGVDGGGILPFLRPATLELDGGVRVTPFPRPLQLALPDGGLPASRRAPL